MPVTLIITIHITTILVTTILIYTNTQEDLLAELEGLEDELDMADEVTEKAPAIPQQQQQQAPVPEAVFNFPSAPQGQLQKPQQQAVQETEDERAIRELQESMLA